ncbi:type II secretion system protein [Methylocaldum sp. MU1018]
MNIRNQRGMTLVELSVVLMVLIGLAGIAMPYLSGTSRAAACQTTDASLAVLRDAIMGSGAAPGYRGDMGDLPRHPTAAAGSGHSLHYLLADWDVSDPDCLPPNDPGNASCDRHRAFNPATRRGWHGPYLLNGSTLNETTGELGVRDMFRNRGAIVLQIPCNDVDADNTCDAGEARIADYARLVSPGPDGALDTSEADANAANRHDDRVLFLRLPDPRPEGNQACE